MGSRAKYATFNFPPCIWYNSDSMKDSVVRKVQHQHEWQSIKVVRMRLIHF